MKKIKNVVFLLLALCLAAHSFGQQQRVTLTLSNVTVKAALEQLKAQSGMDYWINADDVDLQKTISATINSKSIDEALKIILQGQNVHYEIQNNHIVISKAGSQSGSQQKTISGTVTDSNGPIPGVTVMVKGSNIGTATDDKGAYALSVPDRNAVLTFAFLGYATQEIQAGNQSVINVTMEESTQSMNEVVVIGYGTVKKSDLTGSVASISNNQFINQPLTRVDDILKGRMPGAMVLTNSGSPDQNISVRIRGANSIYGGNDPLYIIDGIPSGTLDANINDIQSIEVLKDASATAIYGSRGANGVILVTTKRGIEGKTQVTLETNSSWSSLYKKFDMLSAADYADSYNQYRPGTFSQDQLNAFQAGTAGTNWQDMIFRTAYSQNHKLTVSGGNDKTRYFISGNFVDNQGIVVGSEMRRYALRSNIQSDVTSWLKVDFDVNGYSKKTSGMQGQTGNVGSALADALMYSPVTGLKDANGNWLNDQYSSIMGNPYGRLVQNPNDSYSTGGTANMKLTFFLPVKGLTFNVQGAATYSSWSNFYLNSMAYNLSGSNSAGNSRNDQWDMYNLDQLNYTNQ